MKIQVNGYTIDDSIRFEWSPNPKRVHAKVHGRYNNYSQSTNISEYYELSEQYDGHQKNVMPSLRYDEQHGYLKLFDSEDVQINIKED